MEDSLNQADSQYQVHLEEIRKKDEDKKKREKDWCAKEYTRYNEQFKASLSNFDTYMKSKKETE